MARNFRPGSLYLILALMLSSGTIGAQPQQTARLELTGRAQMQSGLRVATKPAAVPQNPAKSWAAPLPLPEDLPAMAVGTYPNDTTSDKMFEGASIGTGWPLASGYVVTNNHVVSGSREVALLDQQGTWIIAWPVLLDEVNDLALLEVAKPKKLPAALPLSHTQTRLGSSVFTIGFPRIDFMGKTPKLSNGIISGVNGLRDDPCSYQTTVPIQPGNSGGPVLNLNGEVVGIVGSMVGIRDESSGTLSPLPNISCAIKIECLKEILPRLPSTRNPIEALPSNPGNLETVAQRVQGSVMIVVAR